MNCNFRQKLEKAEREKQEYKDLSDRQEARVSTFHFLKGQSHERNSFF
jgi:hypothetical protein